MPTVSSKPVKPSLREQRAERAFVRQNTKPIITQVIKQTANLEAPKRETLDAKPAKPTPAQLRKIARERFVRSRIAEGAFSRQLAKLGKQIGSIVEKHAPNGAVKSWSLLRKALNTYAEQIKPWAEAVVEKLHAEVSQRDAQAWFAASREIGQHLREEIKSAPTGKMMRTLLGLQTDLITSLPKDAAERVHKLTIEGIAKGQRPETVAKEIAKTGHVTISHARMIARTETARTAAALTQARAMHVGSAGYIWRTAMDSDVRPAISDPEFQKLNTLAKGSHRKLEGTFHKWDDPPVAAPDGTRAHPGSIWNCRCWAEPVLPDRV